jgi:hypothetical protein
MLAKMMTAVTMLVLAFTLSGCYDVSTPQDAVKTAGYAVKHGDVKTLSKVLSGTARAEYANAAGMLRLQNRLSEMGKLRVTSVRPMSQYSSGEALMTAYEVSVMGSKSDNLRAQTLCRMAMERVVTPCMGPKATNCPRSSLQNVTRCSVTDLN